ncbi:MAG: glycerol-3-phosphate 1-O-acyltransferase PlsY [Thermosynechococcaceae cyanobacterium MS004]|nr:glycerol-3-phosphate 1-O-acyltransferase PlsY [Thermosynechococcaceae cyanobacterium MS004]
MPSSMVWIVGNGALLIVAYLLGSFPTGYLFGKWLKGIDIRTQGSGSTGATNVLRTLGKGPGITVLLVDVLKGAAAIALIRFIYDSIASPSAFWSTSFGWVASWLGAAPANSAEWFPWVVVLGGLAAVVGHSKSIWLGFSGGKSVAVGLGILLALNWQVGLMTFGVFGLVLALFRIVSLSSICGAIAVPMLMFGLKLPLAYILLGLVGGLYVVLRHRSNIQRMFRGTEPRLGQKVVLGADAISEQSAIESSGQ